MMNKSIYLEGLSDKCKEIRKPMAKKYLFNVILFLVIAIAAYMGLPLLDTRAASAGTILSLALGLVTVIFLVKYLRLNAKINDKILIKCEQEIERNLKPGETFEAFDRDIMSPAHGTYSVNGSKVLVGSIFLVFERLNDNGPSLNILRGDNLGNFDVHYASQGGIGTDIGMDINNKDGKFIRSVTSQSKDEFYNLLDAMEKLKHCANNEDIPVEQTSTNEADPFVEELKKKVKHTDKKGSIKLGILGILLGIFLCIAGNSSGNAFIYGGLALTVVSIVFIISVSMKK